MHRLLFLFACVVICAHGKIPNCSSILYPSTCVEAGCGFCCSNPFGSQCMNLQDAINGSKCGAKQLLASAVNTSRLDCDSLCATFSSCDSCNQQSWCAFCASSSTCVGAQSYCPNDGFKTQCHAPEEHKTVSYMNVMLITVGVFVALTGVAIIVAIVRRNETQIRFWWRGLRAPRQRETLRAETQPLLNGEDTRTERPPQAASDTAEEEPTAPAAATSDEDRNSNSGDAAEAEDAEDGADDEETEAAPIEVQPAEEGENRDCQICLDGLATVVFLPCYHSYCCSECSEQIRPNRRRGIVCPFCRAPIKSMVDLRSLHNQGPARAEQ